MKSFLMAAMYAAIVTQGDSCDLVKKYTGKEWHELPSGTKWAMIIAAIWGIGILILIGDYLMYDREEDKP